MSTTSVRGFTSAAIAIGIAAHTAALPQSPTELVCDPGPLVADGSTGIRVPTGSRLSQIVSLASVTDTPRDLVVGFGGDLFVSNSLASEVCSNVHVLRVAMNGDTPVQPAAAEVFTLGPIAAHWLAYDSTCGTLYAAGCKGQSQTVYTISPGGQPGAIPFGFLDPDQVATTQDGRLFVLGLDSFFEIDLAGCGLPSHTDITEHDVDLQATSAASLGNWNGAVWDPNTGSLVAGRVGLPPTSATVELAPGGDTWVASQEGPDELVPLLVDQRGIRLFGTEDGRVVMVDRSVDPPVAVTMMENIDGLPAIARAPSGLFVLDPGRKAIYRLDLTLRSSKLTVDVIEGDEFTLAIDAGVSQAGQIYLVLGSLSGATPGTQWGTKTIPMNVDGLTHGLVDATVLGFPPVAAWLGVLDNAGRATAPTVMPDGKLAPGTTLHMATILPQTNLVSSATWIHGE